MYVVFGATGQLGHHVVNSLLEQVDAGSITAVGRDESKAADLVAKGVKFAQADYGQPDSIAAALQGAKRVLLISSSEVGQRVPQHQAVIDAVAAAGVELLVYTSILHADDSPAMLATEHRATEAALKASGVPHVILRNGWYNENYEMAIGGAPEHGLIGSAGDGRFSAATRADYGAAAAAALLDTSHAGQVYELAGDTSFTLAELASEISTVAGKDVPYINMSQDDHAGALTAAGLPAPIVGVLVDSDAAASTGALQEDGKALSKLIGRPTTPISETVKAVLGG
jgi:NAD(P)H dehydrogenase (quinone)